jgi:predicted ATPase with chaperone activity
MESPPTRTAPAKAFGPFSALLSGETFQPTQPRSLQEAGLSEGLVESLICKRLLVAGQQSGRALAEYVCLSYGLVEDIFQRLRTRQILTHKGAAALNDYVYTLTDQGRETAQYMLETCAHQGSAPVPLSDYINSIEAQTIQGEVPRKPQLEEAFREVSVPPDLFARLGPAISSGTGLFLYGAPGNGKTTLAERVTRAFGQEIWIPRVILAEGELIKLFDPAYHTVVTNTQRKLLRSDTHDPRWVKIRRPTVVVGGELTMDSLELRHNSQTNVSEAPLQMKSNGGSLLIDDFGRQRMNPIELLNRWIVPLEKRYDFLTLASGKSIQVPFDQLILFSTNLEPRDLVDEAFLRRIPFKINVPDPDDDEFHHLFQLAAGQFGCEYDATAVEYLLQTHYHSKNRPRRRCHPRDLLLQVRCYCKYNDLPVQMTPEALDRAVENYFTVVG